jgi:predicted negative regulator of RcsB-dependent stress response
VSAERVRTLLLRGDNLLKKERPERALEAFEEAREAARGDDVPPQVRELVERRIEALRGIEGGDG